MEITLVQNYETLDMWKTVVMPVTSHCTKRERFGP